MAKFCGDEANIEYQVDAPKVGDFCNVIVQRLDRKSITASGVQEIKATNNDMKWPDQEDPGGDYFGGRQVDFKGLNKKSYADKFAHQNFALKITSMDDVVEGENTEIIDELPAAGPDTKTVGIPMPSEMWANIWGLDPVTNNPIVVGYNLIASDPTGTHWQNPAMNCGKFDIEHKDGVVIITVRVSLVSSKPAKGTKKAFKYLKKRVEAFWNSEANGFNQWVYHRTGCKRGDDCACSVFRNSKGKYLSTGCCKVPFKVVIEEGGNNDNVVVLHYLNPKQRWQALRNKDGWGAKDLATPVDTGNVYYPENRPNTYAHEVGHMLGFPDQYRTGVTEAGAVSAAGPTGAGTFPIDTSSIMGTNQTEAKKIHTGAQWFNDWINANIDNMSPIDR